jgi:hypothetical protein
LTEYVLNQMFKYHESIMVGRNLKVCWTCFNFFIRNPQLVLFFLDDL